MPDLPAVDQSGQTVNGPQTNLSGEVSGPVLSGTFQGPVTVGGIATGEVSGIAAIGHGATVNVFVQQATASLDALTQLAQRYPAVREKIGVFRERVEIAGTSIDELGDYKSLHDLLHQMQFGCYNLLKDRPAPLAIGEALTALEDIVAKVQAIAHAGRVAPREIAWLEDLSRGQVALQQAAKLAEEFEDYAALVAAARDRHLKRLLTRALPRINQKLADKAGELKLARLIDALEQAQRAMQETALQPAQLAELSGGLEAMRALDARLNQLVDAHSLWQELSDELHLAEDSLDESLPRWFTTQWPVTAGILRRCCAATPVEAATKIEADADKFDAAMSGNEEPKARLILDRLLSRAHKFFYNLDADLKKTCDELRAIGKPLSQLLSTLTTP